MRATAAIVALGVAAALWRAGEAVLQPSPASAMPAARSAGPAGPANVAGAAAQPAASVPSAAGRGPAAAPVPAPGQAPNAAAQIARAQAAVAAARRQGKDEQEIYRLRAAYLPAQQVDALHRMEAAEQRWRQRLDALQAACAAGIGCEDARASFTREELARSAAYAAPALRR
jgi:hypothetical protein